MIYVDTSVLVALLMPEPHSAAVVRWYGRARAELASAVWCMTEFASALGSFTRGVRTCSTHSRWKKFMCR